jgi:hypothetical protein
LAEELISIKARCIKVLILDCHEGFLTEFERLLENEGYETTTA